VINLYFHPSPNPLKVAIMLEEAGLPYPLVPVDTFRGEQHRPEFLRLNPNGKVPVIVDEGGEAVFDSNAILLYLADKTGWFLPEEEPAGGRGELLSWLFLVASGSGLSRGRPSTSPTTRRSGWRTRPSATAARPSLNHSPGVNDAAGVGRPWT